MPFTLPTYLQSFVTLILVLTPLFIGFILPAKPAWQRHIDTLLGLLVYVILTLIGIELAQVTGLTNELGSLLMYVGVLAILTISFGVLALCAFDRFFPYSLSDAKNKASTTLVNDKSNGQPSITHSESVNNESTNISVSGSIKQVLCVVVGFGIGKFLPPAFLPPENSMTALLMLLILLVGIGLKASGITLRQVLLNKRGVQTSLIFTLSVLLGGAVFAMLFSEVNVMQGLALASGFGWYSLSAIVMTEAYGAIWGSVALFNDLIREFVALACIPLLMRRYPSSAVGLGGATSLDFTLPVIQQSGGLAVVPLAISFGFIINIISPVLMVLFSSLG